MNRQKSPTQWERRRTERERIRRRRDAPRWIASFVVMVGGTAWFVLTPSTLSYWLGTLLYLPFAGMVAGRAKRTGFTGGGDDPSNDSGPWSGP